MGPKDEDRIGLFCACGCGGVTSIAKKTRTRIGHVKGEHVPFLWGHGTRVWDCYEIDFVSGCWNFTGYVNQSTGYGEWYFGGEKLAHRAMYVKHKGAIPPGFEVDHLCFNRMCINPQHLEAVTTAENLRRMRERFLKVSVN